MVLSRPVRITAWLAGGAALVTLSLSLAFAWWISGFVLEPPWEEEERAAREEQARSGTLPDPSLHGLAFEDVSFESADGLTLRGWWVPAPVPGAPAVVLVHGKGSSRHTYVDMLPALNAAGHSVLAYDSRAHGASDDPGPGAAFAGGWKDVLAAAAHAREAYGATRVGVLGHSQGASSALLAGGLAGRDDFDPGGPRLDAVIASAGGSSLYALLRGTDSLAWVPDWQIGVITRVTLFRMGSIVPALFNPDAGPGEVVDLISPTPLFLLHGEEDAGLEQAHALYEKAREPKELWVLPGTGHETASHPEFVPRVVAFLDDHLTSGNQ